MQKISLKSSILWMNIGEVAVQNGTLGHSFYQCAHLYDNCRIVPQTPVLSA